MRQFLIDVLKLLEEKVPPQPLCHHALMYTQYGNDENGWEDRLALQVNFHGQWFCFFLDKADFEKTPNQLVELLLLAIKEPLKANTQLGTGPGKIL